MTRIFGLLALLAVPACGQSVPSRGNSGGQGGRAGADTTAGSPAQSGGSGAGVAGTAAGPGGLLAGSGAGGGAAGRGVVLPSPDYTIAPAALVGCRSPDQAGCLKCCVGGDPCGYRDGDADSSMVPGEPWYSHFWSEDGACPADCQLCASCGRHSEEDVRQLLTQIQQTPDCDCSTVTFSFDDCIKPSGCACLCGSLIDELEVCPPAD